MLQCFSNGLEHIKLKMNSRSSRHHVERWLSLHFPFSECSIITTAVTFIARVCVCLCAHTVCAICLNLSACMCAFMCACVCVCACYCMAVCSGPLQEVMCRDKGSHLPDSRWKGSHALLFVLAPVVQSREMLK